MNNFEELKHFIKLPTLYDFFLSQEKISYEIRRQNKELNLLKESVENLYCLFEIEKNKNCEIEKESKIEMDLDYIFDFINSFKLGFSSFDWLKNRLLEEFSKNSGFFKKKKNLRNVEQMLQSFEEGLDILYKKLILHLNEYDITVIEPKIGDKFSPSLHKAIQVIDQGKEEKIEKVISCGFLKKDKVLVFSNVIIK